LNLEYLMTVEKFINNRLRRDTVTRKLDALHTEITKKGHADGLKVRRD
jgi:hypothetical protein